MRVTTSSFVAADRERVFDALINPDILRRVIPGCESLTPAGPDAYDATMKVGVAGLKGTYKGKTAILEKQPPEALKLTFEGKGGPGFMRGSAAITLASEGAGTRVTSDADVQVGGLIAAVGSRLVEATARKMAEDFFARLSEQLLRHAQ